MLELVEVGILEEEDIEHATSVTFNHNRCGIANECWCPITSSLFRRPLTSNDSLVNYFCLVFGNNCLMSVPYKDGARISNPSYLNHMWKRATNYNYCWLLFPGSKRRSQLTCKKVAATYFKDLKINENSDPRKQSISEDCTRSSVPKPLHRLILHCQFTIVLRKARRQKLKD
ncbi:hypothetical protein POM88_035764 [Heracleum sosnowskyi]|uniref:Uncharacterized protein n=1 Tax=Heracleum sosnowskyi TaxID=360622 RepID=A0AAD8HNY1_9APIA|nr:hypothetical protein POM88_035764 [Heracleum sosnowskyi]